jgi:N-acetylglucosamine-6-phosphate deacetylase
MKIEGISVIDNTPLSVQIEGERIGAVSALSDGSGLPLLSPGFLDMQVNGVLHSDYHLESFSGEKTAQIVEHLERTGTTQHIATFITSPQERLLRNLRSLIQALAADHDLERAIPAIHVEGPFISPEDGPRGAHDLAYVRPPDIEEVKRWQEAAEGRIRMVTLSPEWEGSPAFIETLTGMGIVAAIGHTAATVRQIRAAVEAGARLSTHLGNGSHQQIPRLENYIWEQLAEDRLSAGIISDGFHLPDSVLKVFLRVKGSERLILVSDVAYLAGCEPGIYKRGTLEIEVFADGHLGLPGTKILAGAAHTLEWNIPRFAAATGLTLGQIIPTVTTNPARLLGLERAFGTLKPGAPANLVLFRRPVDSEGADRKRLQILKTIRAGRVVHAA